MIDNDSECVKLFNGIEVRNRSNVEHVEWKKASSSVVTLALTSASVRVATNSGSSEYDISAGNLWFRPAGVEFSVCASAPGINVISVALPVALDGRLRAKNVAKIDSDPVAAGLLSALGRCTPETDPLLVESMTRALTHRAASWLGLGASGSSRNVGRIARVIEYINNHISKALTISELAGVACLSPHHFARQFRRSTGQTPHGYVLRRRLERSKEMLLRGCLSLTNIALACGFASQSHFTTAFRRAVGETPGHYARRRLIKPPE